MAQYTIYNSSDTAIASGFPKYTAAYGKVPYIEFNITSPTPIAFTVGCYVDYRDERYFLYSVPEPKKQARSGLAGDAFVYQNLQFHTRLKELENLIFTDLVLNSGSYFFSSRESTSTYEDLYGIINRLHACLNDQSDETWIVRLAPGVEDDPNLYAITEEPHEFSISGQSILEVCNQVADIWKGIGWLYSYDSTNDTHYISFGAPNIRTDDYTQEVTYGGGTTGPFIYGNGNGLVSIKKYQTNKDKFLTRLYAYGSERNMPLRYYNSQSIVSADSVDIPNLMLPSSEWGTSVDPDTSETLPDARLAYIDDSTAIDTYGLIPRRIYFNNEENGDIYPTIKGVTIQDVIDAIADYTGSETYISPSTSIYSTTERVDVLKGVNNPPDDGKIDDTTTYEDTGSLLGVVGTTAFSSTSFGALESVEPNVDVDFASIDGLLSTSKGTFVFASPTSPSSASIARITLDSYICSTYGDYEAFETDCAAYSVPFYLTLYYVSGTSEVEIGKMPLSVVYSRTDSDGSFVYEVSVIGDAEYSFTITEDVPMSAVKARISGAFALNLTGILIETVSGSLTIIRGNGIRMTHTYTQPKSCSVTIKQIGFDLNDVVATNGAFGTLNMMDGNCGGRAFKILSCTYNSATDDYTLLIQRVQDESTAMIYPNTVFPLAVGDKFVITDIYMPDIYVEMAEQKLLSVANSYYALNSVPRYLYTPEIDSSKIADGTFSLPKPGMYMQIQDSEITSGSTEYILIDSVTVSEGESSIPIVNVTLRERLNVPESA